MDPVPGKRVSSPWLVLGIAGGAVAALLPIVLVIAIVAAISAPRQAQTAPASTVSPHILAPGSGVSLNGPLVLTYYYYWYDVKTAQHLGPNDPLPTHPLDNPPISWSSVDWHQRQLADMSAAGIDVVLPVYWGYSPSEQWSTKGLGYLVEGRNRLISQGSPAPSIGMFFDTSILDKRDLREAQNIAFFYSNVKDFFSRVPQNAWALRNGHPIVWLFLPQNGNTFNQSLFDFTYAQFTADFGVRPYIVRATGWDCAIVRWDGSGPKTDCSQRIQTDASFVWGVAQDGTQPVGSAAAVGPGYDESLIPGRRGIMRPRDNGKWYQSNFAKAIASHRDLLAIETWNEFHEASGICETKEYGRQYIDLTKHLSDAYRASFSSR